MHVQGQLACRFLQALPTKRRKRFKSLIYMRIFLKNVGAAAHRNSA